MDELTIEDLKQLVTFYNNRANEAESKNVEFQLITNGLRKNIVLHQSKIRELQLEIEKMYRPPEPVIVAKPVGKTPKAKA
jgi:hypothetical protein